MKKNLIFFFVAIEIGVLLIAALRFMYPPQVIVENSPQLAASFPYNPDNPPSQSLVGTITTMAGELTWQSREATKSALVKKLTRVLQGEKIETTLTGTLTIDFQKAAEVIVSGDSSISIVQTLPQNLVFNQNRGTVIYSTNGNSAVSVRNLHLLTDQTKGKMSITVDPETAVVAVKAITGDLKLGYNDLELTSQTLTLLEGTEAIFNDENRTILIKKLVTFKRI